MTFSLSTIVAGTWLKFSILITKYYFYLSKQHHHCLFLHFTDASLEMCGIISSQVKIFWQNYIIQSCMQAESRSLHFFCFLATYLFLTSNAVCFLAAEHDTNRSLKVFLFKCRMTHEETECLLTCYVFQRTFCMNYFAGSFIGCKNVVREPS